MVILNETIEGAKKNRSGRKFFKINFVMVYDLINWGHLDMIMDGFNFLHKWRQCVMGCITCFGYIFGKWNVSQANSVWRGDSDMVTHSSYLFLIAAIELSILLSKVAD